MIKFPVHNLKGERVRELELSPSIFGLPKNDELLRQVYTVQAANRRRVIAHTKDRAERAGSGRKPWRQKGTGRARAGSVRSPIWRKGGITFGPTRNRNFKKDIPQKMKRKALLIVLSGKARDKELVVVENLKIEKLKTKKMRQAVDSLKLKGSILLGFSNRERDIMRASRNLPDVVNIDANRLNVFDILNCKYLVVSEESIKMLEGKYGRK